MALVIVFLVLLLVCSLVVAMAVAQQWFRWLILKLRHNRPGPIPIPIIGHLLHLMSSPCPHRSLSQLAAKYGPVLYLQLGILPTVIVSTSAAAQQVLHSHDKSLASRPYFTSLARFFYGIDKTASICPYNDQWRWTRKFYSLHILNARSLHEIHVPIFRDEILRALLGDVYVASRAGSDVNLSKLFSTLAQNIMYRILFDKLPASSISTTTANVYTFARQAERLASVNRIGEFMPFLSFLDRSLDGAIDRCHRSMDAILEAVITEREKMNEQPAPALDSKPSQKCILDIMLASDPPMDRDQMKAMITELLIGGTATTASALEWAMAELLNNERVMRKAVEEVDKAVEKERMVSFEDVRDKMPYVKAVVKETLRLYPPAPLLFPHFSTEPCDIKLQQNPNSKPNGSYHGSTYTAFVHRIEAGTRVIINAWAIGRDEETWGPSANEFSPERFLLVDSSREVVDLMKGSQDLGLLPFGSGRRMCPGHMLATSFLELAIATFLHCFQWTRNNEEGPLDMSEDFGLNLIRHSPLFALPTSFRLPSNPAPPTTIH